MKKLILISALLLVTTNGWTQVSEEIHQRCKDVADYVGCVQIFSGTIVAKNNNKLDLENALKLLPRRLENTVLRDFSNAIEPFSDALSMAEGDKTLADSELLSDSIKIEKALYIARKAWNDSIEANVASEATLRSINRGLESLGLSGSLSSMSSRANDLSDLMVLNKLNSCFYKNNEVHSFNEALGGRAMDYPCDINKAQDCDSRYNKDIHSQMLIVIADAAIDVSNSEELDYPSIESIKLNTNVGECENKYAKGLNDALAGAIRQPKAQEPFKECELIEKVSPVYPSRALSRGVEGYCIVVHTVTSTGTTKKNMIIECTSSLFASASIRASEKLKYKPGVINGQPIDVPDVQHKITFKLQELDNEGKGELNILLEGAELSDYTPDGFCQSQSVIILSIEPNSKADRARLKSGDIITGEGNTTIDNLDDFIAIIKDKDSLILQVNRNGRKFIIQMR